MSLALSPQDPSVRCAADSSAGLKPGRGVSPERQQAIVAALRDLAPGTVRL